MRPERLQCRWRGGRCLMLTWALPLTLMTNAIGLPQVSLNQASGRPSLSIVVVDHLLNDLVGRLIDEIASRRRDVLDSSRYEVHAKRCGCSGSASRVEKRIKLGVAPRDNKRRSRRMMAGTTYCRRGSSSTCCRRHRIGRSQQAP